MRVNVHISHLLLPTRPPAAMTPMRRLCSCIAARASVSASATDGGMERYNGSFVLRGARDKHTSAAVRMGMLGGNISGGT